MIPQPLTPRQQQTLDTWRRLRDEAGGICPTFQQLADAMSVSRVTIYEHMHELVRKGHLTAEPFKSRGFREVGLVAVQRSVLLDVVGKLKAAGMASDAAVLERVCA